MNAFNDLYNNLISLCETTDAFYYVETVRNDVKYRVFSYRLASFTDFQLADAKECRGHTFRYDYASDTWQLASLPSAKFFNYYEHLGWGDAIDLSKTSMIMDKVDGSLISTVIDENGDFFLKSKTSFCSVQAIAANSYIRNNQFLMNAIRQAIDFGYTVNFELVGPNNQIVIGYDTERLIVLNARHNCTGEYASRERLISWFGDDVVETYDLVSDMSIFLSEIENSQDNIEGVIFVCDGVLYKHKSKKYVILHKLKDSINNERRLWEACINETADDLRALFVDDPVSVAKIIDMEEKAAKVYNHADKVVNEFYNENKHLDRKSYAILGQEKLNKDGLFSIAMNLYLGKDANLKEFLVKNYKKYGIKDEDHE
jgi:T4 RnlA family RNA ligase